MLSALPSLHLSSLRPFAAVAAAACSSFSGAMCLSSARQLSGNVLPAGNHCGGASSRFNAVTAVGGQGIASTCRNVAASVKAASKGYSTRSDASSGPKLPKTMLHVNGIGRSYAKVLRETHGIQTVEQLSEIVINELQAPDGVAISVEPAVKRLQGYGIKRQDCAQRIVRHLTSLYAPELAEQLQAADAAADTAVAGPGLTFCVEGNISAGKSTFLGYITEGNEELQHELGVVHEPVEQWQRVTAQHTGDTFNLLDMFYSDPKKYASTFQNYVFMSRVMQESNSANMSKPVRVMERSVFSDRMVFVRAVRESGWMGDVELAVYDSWFSPILQQRPHLRPHGFIYLKCDPSTCMDRLKLRGRHEEDTISIDYLEGLHAKHEDWLGAGQLAFDVQNRYSQLASRRRYSATRSGLLVPDKLQSSLYYLDKDGQAAPRDMPAALHLVPALVVDCDRDVLNDRDARQDVQDKVLSYVNFMREHVAWQQQQQDSTDRLKRALRMAPKSELHVWGQGAQPGSPAGHQEEAVNTVREGLEQFGSDVRVVAHRSGTLTATNGGNGRSREPTGSLEVLQVAATAAAAKQQIIIYTI